MLYDELSSFFTHNIWSHSTNIFLVGPDLSVLLSLGINCLAQPCFSHGAPVISKDMDGIHICFMQFFPLVNHKTWSPQAPVLFSDFLSCLLSHMIFNATAVLMTHSSSSLFFPQTPVFLYRSQLVWQTCRHGGQLINWNLIPEKLSC